MASLMEELVETLNREEQLYADLIPIQEDKLRAIVANDLAAIGRLSDEEQKLVDEVGVLETKRISDRQRYCDSSRKASRGDEAGKYD